MPKCGTQCYLCDVPIRFDTYEGCSHACAYCFVKRKADISKIGNGESASSLKRFIEGGRTTETNWVDWDIPLHWGGMSDPFQPIEKERRRSYKALKVFAETGYPFLVSTKGKLVADEEYLDLIEKSNCAVQISMLCSGYDVLEKGCPSFEERLVMLEKVSKRAKRTIVRLQPYLHEFCDEITDNLKRFKEAGAYGVVVEGMKFFKGKVKGMVKVGGDFCYPTEVLMRDFQKMKEEAHRVGLKFWVGENRLRRMGDDLCCCGVGDMFKVNTFNLNHLLNGDKTTPTEGQMKVGTAVCFKSINQQTAFQRFLKEKSFAEYMIQFYKENEKNVNEVMGVGR